MERGKHTPGLKEWLAQDWTVGQYTPTESFRTIKNHSCVCRKSDMGLIALTGAAEEEESQRISDLFSAAPELLEALENRVDVACRRTCDADAGLHTGACDQAMAAIAKAKGQS